MATNGDDANPGNQDQPFRTINQGISAEAFSVNARQLVPSLFVTILFGSMLLDLFSPFSQMLLALAAGSSM